MFNSSKVSIVNLLIICWIIQSFGQNKRGWFFTETNSNQCCSAELGCFIRKQGPYSHLPPPRCPNEGNVHFVLLTKEDDGMILEPENPNLPDSFDIEKPIIIFIHGYFGSSYGKTAAFVKETLFEQMSANLILVDWSLIGSTLNYEKGASSTQTVGKYVALNLIDPLVENHENISYDDIWCIGFSLGAHICGIAGRNTKQKIKRVTGLDPAGPSFTTHDPAIRLNKNSAKYVDAYHTDAFNSFKVSLGIKEPVGHTDFYINGASRQPGCNNLALLFSSSTESYIGCSHRRSIRYFFETLSNPCCHVSSRKCSFSDNELVDCKACEENTYAYIGINAPKSTCGHNQSNEGIFLIETRNEELEGDFCTIPEECMFDQ